MCSRPVVFLTGSSLCSWGLGPILTAICLPSSSLDFFSLLLFILHSSFKGQLKSESNKVFLTILLPFWMYYSHVCVSWITFFNFEIMFLISLCSVRQRPSSSLDPTLANTCFLKDTHESLSAGCCLHGEVSASWAETHAAHLLGIWRKNLTDGVLTKSQQHAYWWQDATNSERF